MKLRTMLDSSYKFMEDIKLRMMLASSLLVLALRAILEPKPQLRYSVHEVALAQVEVFYAFCYELQVMSEFRKA